MWVSVLIGNIIRGIGETPIAPLGISYLEDFARPENSPFYIGKPAKAQMSSFKKPFFKGFSNPGGRNL